MNRTNFVAAAAVVVVGGVIVFLMVNKQESTAVPAVTNSSQNAAKQVAKVECDITVSPAPASWAYGQSQTVELSWKSQGAQSAFLYPPQGGKGGDLITVVMLEGEKVAANGSKRAVIDLPVSPAPYPYDFSMVVKGESGVALCTTRGNKQFRTPQEQKEAENFRAG